MIRVASDHVARQRPVAEAQAAHVARRLRFPRRLISSLPRAASIVLLALCAAALPAAAQFPSNDIGGGTPTRRGRYTISGTLREAEGGLPVDSVEVQLWAMGGGSLASTFTGSNGNFAFSDVPSGTYYLIVQEEGYTRLQEEVNFSNRPAIGIQLLLKREALFESEKVGNGPTVSARDFLIPRRAREAMERGLSLLNGKSDYRGSITQFQRAVREYPQYYEAYTQMGVAYMKSGDAAKSEQSLRTAIDMSERKYADALFNLAAVCSSQKRFADAEPLAREALKINPNSWQANQELARALHGLDQTAAAETSALEAQRIQPDNPQTYLLLANIHLKMRNYTSLIKDLDNYLQLAPNGPDADQARQMREQVFQRMANIQPR